MKKVITFIIPSYNVSKYIAKALSSFIEERVMDRIEVLIVNDGSSDETEQIAGSFVDQYPAVFSLINKENGGHGSAINTGVRLAKGTYFKVVDADDWVVTENLHSLVLSLESSDAQVVLTPYHMVDMSSGARTCYQMHCETYDKTYSLEEIMERWGDFEDCMVFHGVSYRTDFYREHCKGLTEGIFYEDHEYATFALSKAERICPLNLYLYEYMTGNTEQSVSDQSRLKRIGHIETVALHLAKYGVKAKLSPAAREFVRCKASAVILSFYCVAAVVNPEKQNGRSQCKSLHRRLNQIDEEYSRRLRKKYLTFMMMNCLHINSVTYQKLLHSRIYKVLRSRGKKEKMDS